MTSMIRDWAERREAECAELSDIYDSASSTEGFMLEVDQLLPRCPKTLVRICLMYKWLEKHPYTLCSLIILGVVVLWAGPLVLAAVFWAVGRHAAAVAVLSALFAAFCWTLASSYRSRSSGKCWRIAGRHGNGR